MLKTSLENVTNKLIRSYKVIARLNYQNNSMRKRLHDFQRSTLLLSFMLFEIFAFAQQAVPKNANTIFITDSLDFEQNYNTISELLFTNGYGIFNADKSLGTITTNEKPLKNGSVRLIIMVKDNRIIIKGQVNANMEMSLYGVTSKSEWEQICYAGMKKSILMNAWNEMNKIAEALPGSKEYQTN